MVSRVLGGVGGGAGCGVGGTGSGGWGAGWSHLMLGGGWLVGLCWGYCWLGAAGMLGVRMWGGAECVGWGVGLGLEWLVAGVVAGGGGWCLLDGTWLGLIESGWLAEGVGGGSGEDDVCGGAW